MGNLRESSPLVGIHINVVDIQRGVHEAVGDGLHLGGVPHHQLAPGAELEVDADLVVLEGDQGEGEAGVAAEPEVHGDVHRVLGQRGGGGGGRGQSGVHADHVVVAELVAGGLRELVPHVHPLAVLAVDALAADVDVHGLDERVADEVHPAVRGVAGQVVGDLGQLDAKVHPVDEIAVARDGACDLLAEVHLAVERLLNRFQGEVRMSSVHGFEERNLWASKWSGTPPA